MRIRFVQTLSTLTLGACTLALLLGALALGLLGLDGYDAFAAVDDQPASTADDPARSAATESTPAPMVRDGRFRELMTNWKVVVPAGVDIHKYSFTFGFDGRFRRGTLTSTDAPAPAAETWVSAVAAQWGVAPHREDGNDYWAAWFDGVGHVRAPTDGDTVQFVYAAHGTPGAFSMPTDWADGTLPTTWQTPLPTGLEFTDARVTYTEASTRYESFATAPADAAAMAATMTALAADGWQVLDAHHATRGDARLDWRAEAGAVSVTFRTDRPRAGQE